MAASLRPALGALAALLVAAPAGAAEARRHPLVIRRPPPGPLAAPLGVAIAPGLVFETPFTLVAGGPGAVVRVPHYIGPDGTYAEHADLVRSINGTPCGQECTRESLQRWGYLPAERGAAPAR